MVVVAIVNDGVVRRIVYHDEGTTIGGDDGGNSRHLNRGSDVG